MAYDLNGLYILLFAWKRILYIFGTITHNIVGRLKIWEANRLM